MPNIKFRNENKESIRAAGGATYRLSVRKQNLIFYTFAGKLH